MDVVHPILDLLSYIRTERLIMTKTTEYEHSHLSLQVFVTDRLCCCRARSELLILCGYIGALLAIRRNYASIVPALYEYTRCVGSTGSCWSFSFAVASDPGLSPGSDWF